MVFIIKLENWSEQLVPDEDVVLTIHLPDIAVVHYDHDNPLYLNS
jgi:hypothetical protein